MNKLLILFMGLTILSVQTVAQSDLIGPILVSGPINHSGILLWDLGTERVWGIWTAVGSLEFRHDNPADIWSPDGCRLLLYNRRINQWAILSVETMALNYLVNDSEIAGTPIWHPDSQRLTFAVFLDPMEIHVLDTSTGSVTTLFRVQGRGRVLNWLSASQLLYTDNGYFKVYDLELEESYSFGSPQYPRSGPDSIGLSLLHTVQRSPNWLYVSRYYSVRRYNQAVWQGQFDGLEPEQFEELNEELRMPGFELYDLNLDTRRTVSVNNEFIRALEWSPTSTRILVSAVSDVSADDGSIYIYSLEDDTLRQVEDFPALSNSEYGPYIPTWSSDEQWIALRTTDGHIVYNLQTRESMILDKPGTISSRDEFTSVYMRLQWSPIMDYSLASCT
jgi:Tol biopolymer transport system component